MASAAFRMTCRHDFVAGAAFLKRISKFAKASCNLLILDLRCADFVAGAALCKSRCADFVAGAALCESRCADCVAGAALCESRCADFVTGAALCESRCADFVAGAALCEARCADFVAGAALCESRCADFVAGTALCESQCADFVAGAVLCEPRCADFIAGAVLCELRNAPVYSPMCSQICACMCSHIRALRCVLSCALICAPICSHMCRGFEFETWNQITTLAFLALRWSHSPPYKLTPGPSGLSHASASAALICALSHLCSCMYPLIFVLSSVCSFFPICSSLHYLGSLAGVISLHPRPPPKTSPDFIQTAATGCDWLQT